MRTTWRNLRLYGFGYTSNDLLGYMERAAETTLDPALGLVVFEPIGDPGGDGLGTVEGFSAVLRSAVTGGEIYPAGYANEMHVPSAGLSATTRAGWGFFANVQPGEYLLCASHPTRRCVAHAVFSWPAPEGSNSAIRLAVHAGAISYAAVYCSAPP